MPEIHWKSLLGPADTTQPEKRTPLGVRYRPNGFDHVKPKRLTKAVSWLRNRQVPDALTAEFLEYANLFVSDPRYIPLTIDAAYSETRAKYLACGGQWKAAALKINPSDLIVIVEPAPVWSTHWNTYAAGLAWMKESKIQAVCVTMNGLMTQPQSAGPLRKFSDLVRWEMGNVYSFHAGHRIKTPADELGSMSPCQTRPRSALISVNAITGNGIIQP